jgi:hypothetical protein
VRSVACNLAVACSFRNQSHPCKKTCSISLKVLGTKPSIASFGLFRLITARVNPIQPSIASFGLFRLITARVNPIQPSIVSFGLFRLITARVNPIQPSIATFFVHIYDSAY